MLVGEPDELGLERAHPQLALGARLVELAEANGHVAADDDRTSFQTRNRQGNTGDTPRVPARDTSFTRQANDAARLRALS